MLNQKITADIIEGVLNFYDISGKELFFSDTSEGKKIIHIKKVLATLLKEVGKKSIEEISGLFGESIVDTRKKYLQGINRKALNEIERLARIIRSENSVKLKTKNKRRSEKYK